MNFAPQLRKAAFGGFCVLLFLGMFLRELMIAMHLRMGADEDTGIAEALDNGYGAILRGALRDEASPAPLHYLLDKAWMALWGNQPQLLWNLRVFFRVPPAALWSAAGVLLFCFLYRTLRRLPELPAVAAWLFALGGALSLNSIDFLLFFGGSDRPYAAWFSLSVLQLLLFSRLYLKPFRRRDWWAYCAATALLPFAAHPAIAQVLATFGVRWFLPGGQNPRNRTGETGALLAGIFLAVWYGSHGTRGVLDGNHFSQFASTFFDAAGRIPLATFRSFNGYGHPLSLGEQAWPGLGWTIFYLLSPIFFFRYDPEPLRALTLVSLSMALATLAAFLGCKWAMEPLEPRYLVFAYPFFFCLHWLALFHLARQFRAPRGVKTIAFLFFSGAVATLAAGKLWADLSAGPAALPREGSLEARLAHIISPTETTLCPKILGSMRYGSKNSLNAERINDICHEPTRYFTSSGKK